MRFRASGLGLLAVLLSLGAASAQTHVYFSATQALADRVIADAKYPLPLVNEWTPFPYPPAAVMPTAGARAYESVDKAGQSTSRGRDILWGEVEKLARDSGRCQPADEEIACAARRAVGQFNAVLDLVDHLRSETERKGKGGWQGPTQRDTDAIRKRGIQLRTHLAHLRVDLEGPPSLKLGTTTTISGVAVTVDAVGQVWSWHPDIVCTKYCLGICCWVELRWSWHKIGEGSVGDVPIKAGASATAEVDNLVVYLKGRIDRLRVDVPILREIPLEYFANLALNGRRFPVIDTNTLVAALPYVNVRYRPKRVSIGGSGELRVDVEVEKAP